MQLTVKSDRSEQFVYNSSNFPVYIGKGKMSDFPNYAALCHWHDDLEFSLVLSGSMEYNVNGESVRVREGEGVFINTRQLHYNYSRGGEECRYLCVLMHPMLLCASPLVEQDYVAPLLTNHTYPYQVLRRDSDWGQKICRKLKKIDECRDNPLLIQAAFFQIWHQLYQNAPQSGSKPKPRSQNLSILQEMIAYVQKNYQQKLTLDDIAQAGNVSKTTCHNIFRKYVNQSPNAYLIEYRLRTGR